MATKMAISILACFMAFMVMDTAFGFIPMMPTQKSPCETDVTRCGVDPVTFTQGFINYCCEATVTLTLEVKKVSGKSEATCLCAKPFDYKSFMPGGGNFGPKHSGPRCTTYNPATITTEPCGKDGKTGSINNEKVCCKAGLLLDITKKTKRGVTTEYCRCKPDPSNPVAAAAAPPPGAAAAGFAPVF